MSLRVILAAAAAAALATDVDAGGFRLRKNRCVPACADPCQRGAGWQPMLQCCGHSAGTAPYEGCKGDCTACQWSLVDGVLTLTVPCELAECQCELPGGGGPVWPMTSCYGGFIGPPPPGGGPLSSDPSIPGGYPTETNRIVLTFPKYKADGTFDRYFSVSIPTPIAYDDSWSRRFNVRLQNASGDVTTKLTVQLSMKRKAPTSVTSPGRPPRPDWWITTEYYDVVAGGYKWNHHGMAFGSKSFELSVKRLSGIVTVDEVFEVTTDIQKTR